MIYLIGSLRNPEVPKVEKALLDAGHDVFAEWYSAGPIADDAWKDHQSGRGLSYEEALKGPAAEHVFRFDEYHLNRAKAAILILPAGISGHLELGYIIGQKKPGYVLFPHSARQGKLSPDWKWLAGLYEGEGSCTCSQAHGRFYPRLSIASTDKDVLERVVSITKIGRVSRPYSRRPTSCGRKPIYFWQPGKLDDIMYIVRGIWHDLGQRRRQQIMRVFGKIGLGDDFTSQGKPPYEFRWDVMYKFATGVVATTNDLIARLEEDRHALH